MKQKFKVISKVNPLKPKDPAKFYPTPVYNGTYSLNDVSKQIAKISTVSEIDVAAVLRGFISVFPDILEKGNRINLEGLGIYSLGFETSASEKEEDVTSKNVTKVKLKFSPEFKLKKSIESIQVEKV